MNDENPSDEKPVEPTEGTDEERARRRRLKALIIGTIAAGGAFQLNGWQAQANGNRSSGKAAAIRGVMVEGTATPTDGSTIPKTQNTPDASPPKKAPDGQSPNGTPDKPLSK